MIIMIIMILMILMLSRPRVQQELLDPGLVPEPGEDCVYPYILYMCILYIYIYIYTHVVCIYIYNTMLCYVKSCYDLTNRIILHYTILYYTISCAVCHSISYHSILCYIMLHIIYGRSPY